MAVQQLNAAVLNGRIWVAGGVTTSAKATASTQIYDPDHQQLGSGSVAAGAGEPRDAGDVSGISWC